MGDAAGGGGGLADSRQISSSTVGLSLLTVASLAAEFSLTLFAERGRVTQIFT